VTGLRELARRPEAALFAAALGMYAYFFQGGGWNQNSRFNLVRSIVEQHTIVVDDYVHNTGDIAMRDGHYYCDKAPGVSMLALPVYAAVHPFAGGQRPRGRLVNTGAYLATVWAVALPSALGAVMLYQLALLIGAPPPVAAATTLAYAFGTLALPYSTLFYGHQLAAAVLILAFGLLATGRQQAMPFSPRRLFVVGLLLGAGVAIEYPGALGLAAVGLYAATVVRPWPRLFWLAAGAALPALALAGSHTAAWGGPFMLPGHFSNDPPRQSGAFMGITWPSLELVGKILFSKTRGLFRHAPWLLLWLPGVILLARRPRFRAEAVVCLLAPLLYLWFNSSLTTSPTDWRAGWGIGPRHLVATLPFYALGAAALFAAVDGTRRRVLWALFAPLAGYSAALMFVATAVQPEVPTWFDWPFGEHLFPSFLSGQLGVNTIPIHTGLVREQRQAWNLGETLGLRGLVSLLPLAAYLAATAAWLVHTLRSQRTPATS
jgi:hypothetical protein